MKSGRLAGFVTLATLGSCSAAPAPSETKWKGAVIVQQQPGTARTDLCFGSILAISPPGAYANGCPGIVVQGYEWPMPPTDIEIAHGRIAQPLVEGTLSTDGFTFTISKIIDRTTLTSAENKAFGEPQVVEPPTGFECGKVHVTVVELGNLLHGKPALTRAPINIIEDGSGGEEPNYRILVAFANDDTFRTLCDAGIGLQGITIVDPMHPQG